MTPSTVTSRALPAILFAGLTCGVMDITAAFATGHFRGGVSPTRILRGIASGLLGSRALRGGIPPAALGLAIHFLIAFSAATVFYFASRRIAFLTQRPVLAGILYGATVYVFMYWVVVPLSRIHRPFPTLTSTIIAILTHFVCVGLPISLIVRHFSK